MGALGIGKNVASIVAVKEDNQLTTDGPYQITRHPIYTGVLGMILGSAFSLGEGSFFLGFLMILFVFLNRIRIEEEMMTNTFGDSMRNTNNVFHDCYQASNGER